MPKIPDVYSPHDSAELGYREAKRAAELKQFGIVLDIPGTDPSIKDYFAPLLPWEICAIQAQPSNGKTMFTNWWERKIALQLAEQGRKQVIVHVSLEESVEAMSFMDYGRILQQRPADFASGTFTNWERMEWAMTQIESIPIWRIGDSSSRPEDAPDLTLSNIYRAVQQLKSGKVTGEPVSIAVLIVDYLQALPIDPETKAIAKGEDQRRIQVHADVHRLRKATVHLQCPIIVDVQAKQELKGANLPMLVPGMFDGMETAGIAQRFDRILSLWMPKTTNPVGSDISRKGSSVNFRVKENQAFLKVNKQRGGLPAGMVWELKIDYQAQEYYDAYYNPNLVVPSFEFNA